MLALRYGTGTINLRIPPERLRLVEPAGSGTPRPALEALRESMAGPLAGPPLKELASGRRVTYIVDDATRAEPHEALMRAVLEQLGGAAFVRCVVGTGSHERFSEGNKRIVGAFGAIASETGVPHEVSIHDCEDASLHASFGTTPRGTPVEFNRQAMDADLFVVTADVKNHYFAGYSNPLKGFLPAISSFAAIERNHSFALASDSAFGRHPWHPDAARRRNPVAEDMLDAMHLGVGDRPVFVLAGLATPEGLLWSGAGEMETVTREAMLQVDRRTSVRVEPCRYMIVCPGGHPEDETLYNAQRGLELSRAGVLPGGEVLMPARCEKGVASTAKAREEFYDRLTAPLDDVMRGLEERYVLYSHKAYKFAQLIRSLKSIVLLTELPPGEVRAAHLAWTDDAQQVVDRWVEESDEPILVSPRANKVALLS
jgi:nickel-dependent lactate racemase